MPPIVTQPAPSLPFTVPAVRSLSLVRLATELARKISEVGRVLVEGEVHRPSRGKTGRIYFVLKDRTAQVSVSVPANKARMARIVEGERVAVTGTIQWIIDRGQISFEATEVTPVGAGAIAAAIAAARERMRAEGLLDRPRKTLPLLPTCVGVVCGLDAAVRKDIESVVAARFPGFPLQFCEVTVSGSGAAESVTDAILWLDRQRHVDVILIARGGGDATQLLPFSDETLCRVIAASTTPVVSAIGHDEDRPLSDELADARAGTPSIAAAMVIPDRDALLARIEASLARAHEGLGRRGERAMSRLSLVGWRTALDRGIERAASRLERIDWEHSIDRGLLGATGRLERVQWRDGLPGRLELADAKLGGLRRSVEALSPARVLERGYAVVRREDGSVVRRAADVATGTVVDVTVAEGRFAAEVLT